MAWAIDSSTPAINVGTVSGADSSSVSAAFSPPASSLLVMLATTCRASVQPVVTSVTDSLGTHLNWTKLVGEEANVCSTAIWIADVPATAPGSMTVTVNYSTNTAYGINNAVAVAVLTGAKPVASQTGKTATATSTSGTPSATLSSLVGSGSLCLAAVENWTNTTLPTLGTGQSDVFNSHTWSMT